MKKILFRSIFPAIVLVIFVYYISKNFNTIEQTVKVTLSQSLGFLVASFIFAALAYLLMVIMNQKVFRIFGVKRSIWEMLILQASSLAVNVIVPSAGLSVSLMFARDAKDKHESEASAITAVILALLVDYAAIAVMLVIAILYLASTRALTWVVELPAIAFLILTFGLYSLIYFSGKNSLRLQRVINSLINFFVRIVAKFGKEIKVRSNFVSDLIGELDRAYLVMKADMSKLVEPFLYVLGSHIFYIISLYILFLSLGIHPLYRVLLAGYAVGMMFVVISPTPNGVGFVEGSMAFAYASFGIAGAAAATVTIIYRGFSFWLPLLFGFFMIQKKHILRIVESRTSSKVEE